MFVSESETFLHIRSHHLSAKMVSTLRKSETLRKAAASFSKFLSVIAHTTFFPFCSDDLVFSADVWPDWDSKPQSEDRWFCFCPNVDHLHMCSADNKPSEQQEATDVLKMCLLIHYLLLAVWTTGCCVKRDYTTRVGQNNKFCCVILFTNQILVVYIAKSVKQFFFLCSWLTITQLIASLLMYYEPRTKKKIVSLWHIHVQSKCMCLSFAFT